MEIIYKLVCILSLAAFHMKSFKCETDLTELDNETPLNISDIIGRTYGKPDPEVGKLLKTTNISLVNPEEIGSYFEGDILKPAVRGRNGMLEETYRWPNGIVPYEIRGFNKQDVNMIGSAIAEYHKQTCIKFIPRTNQQDYIVFQSGNTGCWSSIGRVGNGAQVINLQTPGCVTKIGTVLHEIMHALGFLHEQNREDRDNYVSIEWSNIKKSAYPNFEKAAPKTTTAFGVAYDTGSVLHYSPYAFVLDSSKQSIIPKDPKALQEMGQRDKFSNSDIKKIWKMYKCKATNSNPSKGNNNVHAIESIGELISSVFKIGDEEEAIL